MHLAGPAPGRERHLCGALTGPVCGKLEATLKNMTLKSNEVTISFTSGPHRSGRGFLLSYSSDQYPGSVSSTACVKLKSTDLWLKCPYLPAGDGHMCVCVSAVVCLLSLNGGRPPALGVFLEPFGALSFHPPPSVVVLFIPAKLLPSSVCCPPAAGGFISQPTSPNSFSHLL